jgi:TM2 domain-containing membrane protein YozV
MRVCKYCGRAISDQARYCKICGADQYAALAPPLGLDAPVSPSPILPDPFVAGLETKNSGLAAILAFILGFFGLWGVGHIYVGKIAKGIVLLVLGILIDWVIAFGVGVGLFALLLTPYYYRYAPGGLVAGLLLYAVMSIGLWIWQICDAYKSAKYYNLYVQRNRAPPW